MSALDVGFISVILLLDLSAVFDCVDLEVLLDSKLSMSKHIGSVTKACFSHLRRIRQIKRCLNEHCLHVLVQALVIPD